MKASEMLEVRVREREALIEAVTERLLSDDRIVAAGLTSSFAREDVDALSDLDILVVVHDENAPDFVPPRLKEIEAFGHVAWCQEVTGNAPPGGSYLGVGFRGTGYPLCTDWYWQPLSLASFPTPSLVFVEKVPIARVSHASMVEVVMAGRSSFPPPDPSPDFTPQDPAAARWTRELTFFWRMAGVAASKMAREKQDEAEEICSQLAGRLADLAGVPLAQGGSGFERIRSQCAFAESLLGRAQQAGAYLPEDRSWMTDTIDFMESLVREGWRSPKTQRHS